MHATALKRKLRNTQSQWGHFSQRQAKLEVVKIQNPDFSYLADAK